MCVIYVGGKSMLFISIYILYFPPPNPSYCWLNLKFQFVKDYSKKSNTFMKGLFKLCGLTLYLIRNMRSVNKNIWFFKWFNKFLFMNNLIDPVTSTWYRWAHLILTAILLCSTSIKRWGKWSPEKLSIFSKVTRLVSIRAWIPIQVCLTPKPMIQNYTVQQLHVECNGTKQKQAEVLPAWPSS